MTTLDLTYWKQALLAIGEAVEREADRLSALDGAVGDGDHGTSMMLGFRSIAAKASAQEFDDIGTLLKMAGMTFMSSIGGVTGIVFGTMFVSAGRGAAGKTETCTDDLAAMFRQSLDGTKARGKASEGDKCMIDALSPAVTALEEASSKGLSPSEALAMAAKSAHAGMEATKDMVAKVGRARYQGENAIGHIDAGAASTALIFETLAMVAKG